MNLILHHFTTVRSLILEGYGGIAYHYVSDKYIALFTHFITCGVWEAVYILDGLLKNLSDIQPDTLYADTQGQSGPVFAISYLLP
jgi:TnpA family transposase